MDNDGKYAMVPTGMTIERPLEEPETFTNEKKKTKEQPLRVKEFDIDPGLPIIQYPHYTNNAKTELSCILVRPDGMATIESKIPADNNHPLYRDITLQFTEAEIQTNTRREIQIAAARDKAMAADKADREREQKRTDLWNVKSEFMDMAVVKNSDEKLLKRNLRKATTHFEALAMGIAILIKESEKSE